MLVVLKIPVVYLCAVVWWAIRAEPRPLEDALLPAASLDPPPGCDWRRRTRRRGPRPRGGSGRFAGPRAVAFARALARAERPEAIA